MAWTPKVRASLCTQNSVNVDHSLRPFNGFHVFGSLLIGQICSSKSFILTWSNIIFFVEHFHNFISSKFAVETEMLKPYDPKSTWNHALNSIREWKRTEHRESCERARKSLNELWLLYGLCFERSAALSRVHAVCIEWSLVCFRMQLERSLIVLLFKIYTFWKYQLFLINFSHLRMLQIMITATFNSKRYLASSNGIRLHMLWVSALNQCRICLHSMNLQLNRNETAGAQAHWRFGNISIEWKRIHCRLIANIELNEQKSGKASKLHLNCHSMHEMVNNSYMFKWNFIAWKFQCLEWDGTSSKTWTNLLWGYAIFQMR